MGATGAAGGAPLLPHATIFASVAQTIPNDAWTTLAFDSEDSDTDGFHSTTVNPSRLTIPTGKGGLYLLVAHTVYDANANGIRAIDVMKNGTRNNTPFGVRNNAASAHESFLNLSAVLRLVAGDFVELETYQNSAGSINSGTPFPHAQNRIELVRLGD